MSSLYTDAFELSINRVWTIHTRKILNGKFPPRQLQPVHCTAKIVPTLEIAIRTIPSRLILGTEKFIGKKIQYFLSRVWLTCEKWDAQALRKENHTS